MAVSSFFQGSKASFFFFDDNPKNVVAAEQIGWHGYAYNQNSRIFYEAGTLSTINGFDEAESIIAAMLTQG